MEDYDLAESKFGRIYKVAGPCKHHSTSATQRPKLTFDYSGRCRENVRIKDV